MLGSGFARLLECHIVFIVIEYKGNVSDAAIFDVAKVNATVDLKSLKYS